MLIAPRHRSRRRSRGFTIVELMVTISLLAIVLGVGLPSLMTWIRNTKIRTVADSLQTGIRQAQADALRLNRSVVFYLTNSQPSNAAIVQADANGRNWTIARIPQFDDQTDSVTRFLAAGVLSEANSSVTVNSATNAICFNANGRVSDNAAPAVNGANCTAGTKQFDVVHANSQTGSDRPLRILVAVGGQVRMCDPNRPTLSATSPDGCP